MIQPSNIAERHRNNYYGKIRLKYYEQVAQLSQRDRAAGWASYG